MQQFVARVIRNDVMTFKRCPVSVVLVLEIFAPFLPLSSELAVQDLPLSLPSQFLCHFILLPHLFSLSFTSIWCDKKIREERKTEED
jgi:hypothetical protein